jgi:hypothetical protein
VPVQLRAGVAAASDDDERPTAAVAAVGIPAGAALAATETAAPQSSGFYDRTIEALEGQSRAVAAVHARRAGSRSGEARDDRLWYCAHRIDDHIAKLHKAHRKIAKLRAA